ncbi:MAG TPA: hemolysin family protein [Candidatus Kapabacteria bacterium]|nr:hemolysin family protein [Candidatus Kapabacteria bacterium]
MDVVLHIVLFMVLLVFSAFFSSAETSLLSLNMIKLNLKAKKKKKKAVLLKKILKNPEEFFSTILIGNNFANIAAATISTILFTRLFKSDEEWVLLVSTLTTTVVILLFGEITPKSFAFRYSERLAYIYTYPILFFTFLFYPLVKITSAISNFIFRKGIPRIEKKDLTIEEVKHFLSSETQLFSYNPESLRMMNEILDIAEKDIKSIMTPRVNIIALDQTSSTDELINIIADKKITKIPLYQDNLDNITGIIHMDKLITVLVNGQLKSIKLMDIAVKPIFISEYSSLNYALKQFKKYGLNIAVVLDEYGSTIGILTLSDIFREILGEIEIGTHPIRQMGENQFLVKAAMAVEEVNFKLNMQLPEKKDYTTLSGLFIYHFGKLPKENSIIKINDTILVVKRMGKRKIDEILVSHHKED